jgi:hypothetical protein
MENVVKTIFSTNYWSQQVTHALNAGLTYDPYFIDNLLEMLGFALPITLECDALNKYLGSTN